MNELTSNLNIVKNKIAARVKSSDRLENSVELIAVSKYFDTQAIMPVIQAGCRIFGENRVQEAEKKWPQLKTAYSDIKLHLIGPLQSNKAEQAVALFDAIHTIDREKIAAKIASEIAKQAKNPKLFIQINTGMESQKSGISPNEALSFLKLCREKYKLVISGLMCIPPIKENPGPHFALLRKLAGEFDLRHLSMGMSNDFETAIDFGATYVRIGSAIFGSRS